MNCKNTPITSENGPLAAAGASQEATISKLTEELRVRDAELSRLRLDASKSQVIIRSLETELSLLKLSWSFKIGAALVRLAHSLFPGVRILVKFADRQYRTLRELYCRLDWRERKNVDLIFNSGYFDSEWYINENPDVAASSLDPLKHFLRVGALEGRDPNPSFSIAEYRKNNPNLSPRLNPLIDAIHRNKIDDGATSSATIVSAMKSFPPEEIIIPAILNPKVVIVIDARQENPYFSAAIAAILADEIINVSEVVFLVRSGSNIKIAGARTQICDGSTMRGLSELAEQYNKAIIVFVASYVVPTTRALSTLIQTLSDDLRIGLVSGVLVDVTKNRIHCAGLVLGNDILHSRAIGKKPDDYRYASLALVDGLTPHFFALRACLLAGKDALDDNVDLQDCLKRLAVNVKRLDQDVACQGQAVAYLDTRGSSISIPEMKAIASAVRATNKAPRVLFVDAQAPTPDQDSGSNDIVNFMKIMRRFGYEVTFLPIFFLDGHQRYTRDLQAKGVICVPAPDQISPDLYLLRHAAEYDVIFVYRVTTATRFVNLIRKVAPKTRIIFDTVDLHFLRMRRQAEIEGSQKDLLAAEQTKSAELDCISKSDCTILLSEIEQSLVQELLPKANTSLIPIVRDVPGLLGPCKGRRGVLFVGGFAHQPNVDAIAWFVAEVWPLVRQANPDAVLFVVGSKAPIEIVSLEDENSGIEVLGFVENLEALMRRTRMTIAPLRYGAGIKGKVVSSLCYGVPCVATSIAVEGMSLSQGDGVLIADTPIGIAQAIASLSEDDRLWENLSNRGVELAQNRFSVDAIQGLLQELLTSLNLPVARPEVCEATEKRDIQDGPAHQ